MMPRLREGILEMDKEHVIGTLERLIAVYESRMQDWTVTNGIQGARPSPFLGLEFGYQSEVAALRAAVESIRRNGVPSNGIAISGGHGKRWG